MKAFGLATLCAATAPFAVTAEPSAGNRDNDPRPNIILILADDLGYGNLGSYGQQLIQTPRLDQMAAEGLRMTRFYAGAPLCLPSRVTLMTGLHMGHSRVRENGGSGAHQPIAEEDVTLSRVLQSGGYRTAMLGKWALGDQFLGNTVAADNVDGPGAVYKHGWDYYLGEPNQSYNHDYYPDHIYRYDPTGFLGVTTPVDRLVPVPLADDPSTPDIHEGYTTDRYSEEALAFIDAAADDPFFLYLAYQTPHKDFVVPSLEPYTQNKPWSTNEKRFASMISRLDRDIGRLLDRLESLGIADNTLVVFTSDNGGLSDFDNRFDNNGNLPGYKKQLTEGGLRVPMIAWWPGSIAPGRESSEILFFPDFMPTFAALAGVFPPEPIDGLSFLPTLMDRTGQEIHKYLFFLEGSNTPPATQDFYVVRGADESRTDDEIYDAAFREVPVTPVFMGYRTVVDPSILSGSGETLPAPRVSASIVESAFVDWSVELPDGIAARPRFSNDLVEWKPGPVGLLHTVANGPSGLNRLSWKAPASEPLREFFRVDFFEYRRPLPVTENNLAEAARVLFEADFSGQEVPVPEPTF